MRSLGKFLLVLGEVVAVIFLGAFIKTFVIATFTIPSESMMSTLNPGEWVLVHPLRHAPEFGDVVVFDAAGNLEADVVRSDANFVFRFAKDLYGSFTHRQLSSFYVKRVMGLPGDTVRCCDAKGRLVRNGLVVDEGEYLYTGDAPSDTSFEVTVPPGFMWVMGDHRSVSADSRRFGDPTLGLVPIDTVQGRVVFRFIPWYRFGPLHPGRPYMIASKG